MRPVFLRILCWLMLPATMAFARSWELNGSAQPAGTEECPCDGIPGVAGVMNEFETYTHPNAAETGGAWGGYYDGAQYEACEGTQVDPEALLYHEYALGSGGGSITNPLLRVSFQATIDKGGTASQLATPDPQWWWNAVITVTTGDPVVQALYSSGWGPVTMSWSSGPQNGFLQRGSSGHTFMDSSSNHPGGWDGTATISPTATKVGVSTSLQTIQGPSEGDNVSVDYHYAKFFVTFHTGMYSPP